MSAHDNTLAHRSSDSTRVSLTIILTKYVRFTDKKKWLLKIITVSCIKFRNTLPKRTTSIFSRWWQVPYYWMGIKAYDLVSGRQILKPSYLLSKRKALELFPMLKKDKLKAALVYYDGKSKQYL